MVQLTNEYGSPSLDDISLVARRVNAEMELAMGEDEAGKIETDISSPVCLQPVPSASSPLSSLCVYCVCTRFCRCMYRLVHIGCVHVDIDKEQPGNKRVTVGT